MGVPSGENKLEGAGTILAGQTGWNGQDLLDGKMGWKRLSFFNGTNELGEIRPS
jgi:hypothetical protein